MSTKDTEIKAMMKALDISKEEAEELYDFDHNKISNDIADSLSEKAKQCGRQYEQSKPTKSKPTRERKINTAKKLILETVKPVLERLGCENITVKTETEIKFNYDEKSYTFKLTEHKERMN